MKIVHTDSQSLDQGDLDFSVFDELGQYQRYLTTTPEQFYTRAIDANVLLVNKGNLARDVLLKLDKLQCICVTATGYDLVDVTTATERNIPVYNVVGYSTHSVAQHVFAMLLSWNMRTHEHIQAVKSGRWNRHPDFALLIGQTTELWNKTLGLVGFGRIAQQVAAIARALGMRVLVYVRDPKKYENHPNVAGWRSLPDLCQESDVISLHIPLTDDTSSIINAEVLQWLRPHAILINTARGGLIDESALYDCLKSRGIQAALLDVVVIEPPSEGNRLFGLDNCWVTPHMAWMTTESRQRLINQTADNIRAFMRGDYSPSVNYTAICSSSTKPIGK